MHVLHLSRHSHFHLRDDFLRDLLGEEDLDFVDYLFDLLSADLDFNWNFHSLLDLLDLLNDGVLHSFFPNGHFDWDFFVVSQVDDLGDLDELGSGDDLIDWH